ncbi:hypothetical protein P152DRAFT_482913 [Eremomyces bilateralis CBS 781.70]|uniref:Glycosyltransferase family 2 protein n=1 Tax=Eremomyces bilateralis CBS 781.70 TaxID=1392243 RepID=A0A6G1G0J1_9PEZI|nr:uncharacterized protein P152DRAFT_482913 [Eremomyces bilateralis CBS 781.70]KAF1811440.1 hypothetical protein P152DRAFT_482913 [Eremomyces bilateralis CBS 781.70]
MRNVSAKRAEPVSCIFPIEEVPGAQQLNHQTQVPHRPRNLVKIKYRPKDVTVIVPSVEPWGIEFYGVLNKILASDPAKTIVTTLDEFVPRALEVVQLVDPEHRYIKVVSIPRPPAAQARYQWMRAMQEVNTDIVLVVADRINLPLGFIRSVAIPFNDDNIGCVSSTKRGIRIPSDNIWTDFWNVVGCVYLARNDVQGCGTHKIDQGISCASARALTLRASIMRDPAFVHAFTHEYHLGGLIGPLNAGDDKFITAWLLGHGWRFAMQNGPEATIRTRIGLFPRFIYQYCRWHRTTWRMNPRILFKHRSTWRRYPWTTYSIFISSLFNFAILWDPGMLTCLWYAMEGTCHTRQSMAMLVLWIITSKTLKPMFHFIEHPADIIYLPWLILFGYVCSFLKFYAGLTFWVISWGSREGL